MGWRMEPCTLEDADALAVNNGGAFWGQPYWRILWPADMKEEYIVEQLRKKIPADLLLLNRAERRHEKAVDDTTGTLLGYARWIIPPSLVDQAEKNDGQTPPTWADRQVADVADAERKTALEAMADAAWWEPRGDMGELDEKVGDARERVVGQLKEYIELDYLAVHPKNQGRGIATDLVRSGLRQAEKLGLPVMVVAFDVSRGIYLRLGFREVEQVLQDDTKFGGSGHYNTYFLIWESPAAAAGNSHPSLTADDSS